MNQLKQNTLNSNNSFKEKIQSILEEMLIENDLWKILKVEVNQNRSEIHAYIHANTTEPIPCSNYNTLNSATILPLNKICTYLSLCGMRTYIHSDEIQIDCPQHGTQFITHPWDQQIKERLKLSIL